MSAPAVATTSGPDIIMDRLEDQIAFYERKSAKNQKTFKRIKITEIIAAALIPFLAAINITHVNWITAGLGVLITSLEGILQLNNYQQIWTTYRATCEALKHEKYFYLANASSYASASNPRAMLAERVESLLSQENVKWVSVQQQATKGKAENS